MPPERLTYRRILAFWAPLLGTWLMIAVEGPYLAAIIARQPEPVLNLAAFGVAFAFAIIVEAPVIMLLSASTALVEDGPSLRALRRFTWGLAALVTAGQVAVLMPWCFDAIAGGLQLPADVARLTHGALAILLPWPAAIAYRRFRQGLLIRHHQTRRVAYGTVLRLAAMSLLAVAAFRALHLPGAYVGALALSGAVVAEALASHLMTRRLVRELAGRPRAAARPDVLRLPALMRFYAPLAMTSTIALSIQPLVTFFMGQARFTLESLAVLRNFAAGLAAVSTAGLSAIAFTPLAVVWFHDISGLSPALTRFALLPVQILAVFPLLSVALHLQRAVLVHARCTRPIARTTAFEVLGVAAVLSIAIHLLDLAGAVAAAVALLAGRVIGVAWLVPSCARVLRATEPAPDQAGAPQVASPPLGAVR